MPRTDEEYIIMGKIVEKEEELRDLRNELDTLERLAVMRYSAIPDVQVLQTVQPVQPVQPVEPVQVQPVQPVHEEELHEEVEEVEEVQEELQEEVHEAQPVRQQLAPARRVITDNTPLSIVRNESFLASEISAGRYKLVRWGSTRYIPEWSKGRKYDPCNERICMIRAELRRGPKSVRELSSTTSLSINTIKDIIREMDRQGFFATM